MERHEYKKQTGDKVRHLTSEKLRESMRMDNNEGRTEERDERREEREERREGFRK